MNLKLIIVFLLLIISCSKEIAHLPGTILFQDPLDGTGQESWRIAPDSFVEHPEYGTVYLIKAANHDSLIPQPWIGDSAWQAYMLEAELLFLEKGSGFIGFDFHVSEDGQRCNNIGFYVGGDLEQPRYVETSVRWNLRNLSWKLWFYSQKSFHLSKDRWMKLRIDIGQTIANVYVDKDSLLTYTTYDLPFYSGGIRFWQYFGSVYLRNLRITALVEDDVQPVLENVWEKVIQLDVIRG